MYGFAEETEAIFQFIRDRGDQRIGQYLINAIKSETKVVGKEEIEQKIWGLNADRLLEILQSYESEDSENDEEGLKAECVACGDGVDSADELEKLLNEKNSE